MDGAPRACAGCVYWDRGRADRVPGEAAQHASDGRASEGKCRRQAPGVGFGREQSGSWEARAIWPFTQAGDWCGEWQACLPTMPAGVPQLPDDDPLDEEQERWLRNTAAAQALLVLSPEKRDELLSAILTEEELQADSPPDDFHERIQRYYAERRAEEEDGG